jgi:hypothetical protein
MKEIRSVRFESAKIGIAGICNNKWQPISLEVHRTYFIAKSMKLEKLEI